MLKFVRPEKEPRAKGEKRLNAPLGSDDVGNDRVQHALGLWRTPVLTCRLGHLLTTCSGWLGHRRYTKIEALLKIRLRMSRNTLGNSYSGASTSGGGIFIKPFSRDKVGRKNLRQNFQEWGEIGFVFRLGVWKRSMGRGKGVKNWSDPSKMGKMFGKVF